MVDTVTVTDEGLDLKVKDKEYKWLEGEFDEADVYVQYKEQKVALSSGDVYYGTVILEGKEIKFANLFEFEYEGLVVDVVKDEIEYAALSDGSKEELLLDDYDDVYVYNKDFTAASVEDIDEGSVIYYWEDDTDAVFIVVVNDVVEGEVTRARANEVTVGGKKYKLAGDNSIISTDAGKKYAKATDATDLLDEDAVLYLDLNGEVAALVGKADVTSDTLYGIATWLSSGRKKVLTVFTADGKEVDYYFEKEADTLPDGLTVGDKDGEYAVVSYELDSDGDIAKGTLKGLSNVVNDISNEITDNKIKDTQDNIGVYELEKGKDKKYLLDGTDRFYVTKDTVVMRALAKANDFDPEVVTYDELVGMEFDGQKAIVFGEEGKNAKFIVFVGEEFKGVKDDVLFGVVTDAAWKSGKDWRVELDLYGEGKEEVKVAENDRALFAKGTLVVFNLDSKDKIDKFAYAELDGNIVDEDGSEDKIFDEEAEFVKDTVKKVDGSFIELNTKGTYKVLDGAVLYKVKYDDNEHKYDGTIRLSRIKGDATDGDGIILVLDKNQEVKAALVNPTGTAWD